MELQIVKALEAVGRLTTRELAAAVGATRQKVYKRCKQLEKDGRLISHISDAREKSIFFFPMTREVVTTENYGRLMQLNEALAEIIRQYSLPQERADLVVALEIQLERLLASIISGGAGAAEAFARELLEAASSAEKPRDVMKLLGIRPMRPLERVWELGPQTALI